MIDDLDAQILFDTIVLSFPSRYMQRAVLRSYQADLVGYMSVLQRIIRINHQPVLVLHTYYGPWCPASIA